MTGLWDYRLFAQKAQPACKKRLESGFSVLRKAVTAIDRPALGRLERNFALFAAVGTDCLVELAGTVLKRSGTPAGISLFHRNFTHF
jgi:hypothetical protein